MKSKNRYSQILEAIFFAHYKTSTPVFEFRREEIETWAKKLKITLPKNLGDLIYSFRYRTELPRRIKDTAPTGKKWIISAAGRSNYRFVLSESVNIEPNRLLVEIKVPDSTPGMISKYALTDEQALLAILRYNRLIDIFTQVACYSLQSHLRTFVREKGQIETDEIYVGVDRTGAHFVFPVQAKGGKDKLSEVQIEQDIALCSEKFSSLICRPIGAQFMGKSVIALFEFGNVDDGIRIISEKHYLLVPPDEISPDDLKNYRLPN